MTSNFSKRDTSIMKGFAIICIVFHNYFRWLYPSPGENEFNCSPGNVDRLFEMLGQQPGEFINLLFSYFGHYGVQLFIFVSGFGLATSMMRQPVGWGSFMLHRMKKLYPLLLTGIVFYTFGKIVMESKMLSSWEVKEIGLKLLLVHTLFPNSGMSVCGPWWFFGLVFQLYLLFPLLFRCMHRWGWKAFWVILLVSYLLIFLFREWIHLNHGEVLMQNAPGHLPEFCFGIMMAFSKDKRLHLGWLVLALVLFIWGNFAPGFYPFTFLSLCVITVFVVEGIKGRKRKRTPSHLRSFHLIEGQAVPFSVLNYFGGLSMQIFVVHGFLRKPVFKVEGWTTGAWWHLCSAVIYFLIIWAVALAAKPFYEFMVRQLDRIGSKRQS